MLVIVDGIDGSGKRTIVEIMKAFLEEKGRKSFDIGEWSKVHQALPEWNDMAGCDLVIGAEPSYVWAGAAVRYEMVRNNRGYSLRDIAQGFAIDRLTLYRRCYLPMLERGAWVINERGVSASIVYQPAADPTLSLEEVIGMGGNALALEHAPDHLVIASLDAKIAMERLAKRLNKQDDHIFEKEAFSRTLDERFKSDWFRQLFESRGTKLHFIDTSGSLEQTKQQTITLLESLV